MQPRACVHPVVLGSEKQQLYLRQDIAPPVGLPAAALKSAQRGPTLAALNAAFVPGSGRSRDDNRSAQIDPFGSFAVSYRRPQLCGQR